MKTLYSFSHPQPAASTPPIQNTEPPDIDGAMREQMKIRKDYQLDYNKVKKWLAIAEKDQADASKVRTNKFNTAASTSVSCREKSNYKSKFLLSGYVDLILHSTAVATTSQSTVEGTMRVLCSYCMGSSLSAFCHSSIRVPS